MVSSSHTLSSLARNITITTSFLSRIFIPPIILDNVSDKYEAPFLGTVHRPMVRKPESIVENILNPCILIEPWHEISKNLVCATSKGSDHDLNTCTVSTESE